MKFTYFNDLNFATDHWPNALFNCRYASWILVIKMKDRSPSFCSMRELFKLINFTILFNCLLTHWYRTLRTHVYIIAFVRQCASMCERINDQTFLETFLSVQPCVTVSDHVRVCSTVCDHAQLPEWPSVMTSQPNLDPFFLLCSHFETRSNLISPTRLNTNYAMKKNSNQKFFCYVCQNVK